MSLTHIYTTQSAPRHRRKLQVMRLLSISEVCADASKETIGYHALMSGLRRTARKTGERNACVTYHGHLRHSVPTQVMVTAPEGGGEGGHRASAGRSGRAGDQRLLAPGDVTLCMPRHVTAM